MEGEGNSHPTGRVLSPPNTIPITAMAMHVDIVTPKENLGVRAPQSNGHMETKEMEKGKRKRKWKWKQEMVVIAE